MRFRTDHLLVQLLCFYVPQIVIGAAVLKSWRGAVRMPIISALAVLDYPIPDKSIPKIVIAIGIPILLPVGIFVLSKLRIVKNHGGTFALLLFGFGVAVGLGGAYFIERMHVVFPGTGSI